MRIIAHLPHPSLKITLLHHGRYLLKLEDADVEVLYRFREEEGVASAEDAQRLLDLGLLQESEAQLRALSEARRRYLPTATEEEGFPEII